MGFTFVHTPYNWTKFLCLKDLEKNPEKKLPSVRFWDREAQLELIKKSDRLAKAVTPSGRASATAMNAPTITTPAMTAMGMILGTAAYMAPEQAKGRPVDRRADIWAFGALVFEMLTGHRAFAGEDVSDTLANVLKSEPAWDLLPADLPARVRQVLRACLQKDAKRRLGDMQSVRLALEGVFETEASTAAPNPQAAPRSLTTLALPWAAAGSS